MNHEPTTDSVDQVADDPNLGFQDEDHSTSHMEPETDEPNAQAPVSQSVLDGEAHDEEIPTHADESESSYRQSESHQEISNGHEAGEPARQLEDTQAAAEGIVALENDNYPSSNQTADFNKSANNQQQLNHDQQEKGAARNSLGYQHHNIRDGDSTNRKQRSHVSSTSTSSAVPAWPFPGPPTSMPIVPPRSLPSMPILPFMLANAAAGLPRNNNRQMPGSINSNMFPPMPPIPISSSAALLNNPRPTDTRGQFPGLKRKRKPGRPATKLKRANRNSRPIPLRTLAPRDPQVDIQQWASNGSSVRQTEHSGNNGGLRTQGDGNGEGMHHRGTDERSESNNDNLTANRNRVDIQTYGARRTDNDSGNYYRNETDNLEAVVRDQYRENYERVGTSQRHSFLRWLVDDMLQMNDKQYMASMLQQSLSQNIETHSSHDDVDVNSFPGVSLMIRGMVENLGDMLLETKRRFVEDESVGMGDRSSQQEQSNESMKQNELSDDQIEQQQTERQVDQECHMDESNHSTDDVNIGKPDENNSSAQDNETGLVDESRHGQTMIQNVQIQDGHQEHVQIQDDNTVETHHSTRSVNEPTNALSQEGSMEVDHQIQQDGDQHNEQDTNMASSTSGTIPQNLGGLPRQLWPKDDRTGYLYRAYVEAIKEHFPDLYMFLSNICSNPRTKRQSTWIISPSQQGVLDVLFAMLQQCKGVMFVEDLKAIPTLSSAQRRQDKTRLKRLVDLVANKNDIFPCRFIGCNALCTSETKRHIHERVHGPGDSEANLNRRRTISVTKRKSTSEQQEDDSIQDLSENQGSLSNAHQYQDEEEVVDHSSLGIAPVHSYNGSPSGDGTVHASGTQEHGQHYDSTRDFHAEHHDQLVGQKRQLGESLEPNDPQHYHNEAEELQQQQQQRYSAGI